MFIVIGLEWARTKIACLIRRHMWCGIGWLNLVRETENIWRVLDWVAIQTDRQCNVNRILGDLGEGCLFLQMIWIESHVLGVDRSVCIPTAACWDAYSSPNAPPNRPIQPPLLPSYSTVLHPLPMYPNPLAILTCWPFVSLSTLHTNYLQKL